MQADVESPEQRRLVATALRIAGDPSTLGAEAREVAQVLGGWDGRTSADSVGAALSHVFVERLVQELLGERLGPDLLERYLASPRTSPVHILEQILDQTAARAPAARGRGELPSDGTVDAVRRSLRESWLFLSVHAGSNREKWAWGRLHTVTFRPLGLAARFGARSDALGPFPCDGDETTVAAAEYDHRQPFAVRLASTYRFAVDTAQLDQALSALVPGESEHPGHPHEADGIARWREGRPRLLGTSRLLIDETSRGRLTLEPASRRQ
jgi:acyl-homoserine lactone acylase PvdQ